MTAAPEIVFKRTEIQTRTGRGLEVRAYGFDDFGALVEMYKRFKPKRIAQGLPPTGVPRIAHWVDRLQNNAASLLAFDGDKIVAHTILCPFGKNEAEFTIFVFQDYREDGLGTILSKLSLEWASEMGLATIFLSTELSNYRALGLFKKLGFIIKSSSGDECEMVLDLLAGPEAQAA